MSHAIDVGAVTSVLLADRWHQVYDASFSLDAYEFQSSRTDGRRSRHGRDEPILVLAGRSEVCATGFSFKSEGGWIYGPLTAVLAVRTAADT